ncbi:MAG: transposase [Streptosporangiaceae bacterium]
MPPERVHMLAELCLEPECRRGHGGVYDALNCGQVRIGRLRRAVAGIPLRRWEDGRIRLACDVSNWLRPDAETSPERLFCHCHARGKGNAQLTPGWPYSWVVALEPGRTSWTLPLDAVRLGPADDATEVTAVQVRGAVARLIAAGHWRQGGPDIIVVFDSGYDLTRLAWLLRDLPAEVAGRIRSDRVMRFPAPPLPARPASTGGRRPRHGAALKLADPLTWPAPAVTTVTDTARYGTATAMAWPRLHQKLAARRGWQDHDGDLPLIEGTLIRLAVDHLPGQRDADPLWLWSSRAAAAGDEVDRTWQAFLRRFDIEHTFRFLKQQPGWTRPKLRDPGRRRPLDLAGHRLLRPASPGPRPRRRHPPALAAALPARPPHPRPRPPGLSPHPPGPPRARQRTENLPPRTRTAPRIKEPAARHPPRHRQDRQARGTHEEDPQAERLNNKFRPGERRCYRRAPPSGRRGGSGGSPRGQHSPVSGGVVGEYHYRGVAGGSGGSPPRASTAQRGVPGGGPPANTGRPPG